MDNQNHYMSIKQARLIVNAHKHNLLKSVCYSLGVTWVLYIVLPGSCFLCMYFLVLFYEPDVMMYCAWSSFLEVGQAHYK